MKGFAVPLDSKESEHSSVGVTRGIIITVQQQESAAGPKPNLKFASFTREK